MADVSEALTGVYGTRRYTAGRWERMVTHTRGKWIIIDQYAGTPPHQISTVIDSNWQDKFEDFIPPEYKEVVIAVEKSKEDRNEI